MNCSILSRKLICLQHNRLIFKVINQRMHARAFKFLKVCFVSTKISLQILCLLFICIHKLNFIVEFFLKDLTRPNQSIIIRTDLAFIYIQWYFFNYIIEVNIIYEPWNIYTIFVKWVRVILVKSLFISYKFVYLHCILVLVTNEILRKSWDSTNPLQTNLWKSLFSFQVLWVNTFDQSHSCHYYCIVFQ